MQTDEEIKKEFEEYINLKWKEPDWDFESYNTLVEFTKNLIKLSEDWWLSKFHTLQEEYKKAQTTCDSIFESYVEPYVVKRNEEYKKQIEERQKLFNFIPQDEYGYKRIKTSDLDIINIINS